MNRIDAVFSRRARDGRKVFIAYLVAGYPSFAATARMMRALIDSGVDMIELGVPFSDPVMDGPTIQDAAQRALARGVTLRAILRFVRTVRARIDIPILLMSYCNPVYTFPLDRFGAAAASAGVDGMILPDLSLEESPRFQKVCVRAGLHLVQFAAPTTAPGRLSRVFQQARGFVYATALTGVTGARHGLPAGLIAQLAALKKAATGPVAVGIGISEPAQVSRVREMVDGIIVGSAFVSIILSGRNVLPRLRRQARSLRKALDR